MPISVHRGVGPPVRDGFLAKGIENFLDLSILSILIQLLVLLRERHIHIDHLEMPKAFQTLDNLAGDVLDTFWVFGGKWGGVEGDDRGRRALAGGTGRQDRGGTRTGL